MLDIKPLQPVLGGVLDPDDVVGRETALGSLTMAIAQGGCYVVGDRRMGKTSLLRLAVRDLRRAGHVVVMVSAETDSLETFTAGLLRKIREQKVFSDRWKGWTKEFGGEVNLGISGQGLKLTGTARKDGARVERDLTDLCSAAAEQAGAASFVLVIDEIATLAWLLRDEEPTQAAELLRWLRRLRQDGDHRMRVVLSGSVGLHHAVDDDTSLNDLTPLHVGSLAHDDAVLLGCRIQLGVLGEYDEDLADRVARAVHDIPYYVQRLTASFQFGSTALDQIDVDEAVDRAIDTNAWDTDHYVTRVDRYYPGQRAEVLEVLDALARDDHDIDSLVRVLETRLGRPVDAHDLSQLLERLRLDHYIDFAAGTFSFVSPFLATVWRRTRTRLR